MEAIRKAGRLTAALRAQIERRLGYVPALFDPASFSAELLESLWLQTRAAYLDSPLPARFTPVEQALVERIAALLERRCEASAGYSLR